MKKSAVHFPQTSFPSLKIYLSFKTRKYKKPWIMRLELTSLVSEITYCQQHVMSILM